MSNLSVLRQYAQKSDPSTLPPSVLFAHAPHSLTIFDAYPKSTFHFLVLPRIASSGLSVLDLAGLRQLLKADKKKAKELLLVLREDVKEVERMIEEEMIQRYGFKWKIWVGFHAVPSMLHVHIHVLSADLCSPCLKTKKHYNSFHPKLGFFLHFDEVLSWFDADPSYYSTMAELKQTRYELLLKDDLVCWRCGEEVKNMPRLKDHLQQEWDKEAKREKDRLERKRKRQDVEAEDDQHNSRTSKTA